MDQPPRRPVKFTPNRPKNTKKATSVLPKTENRDEDKEEAEAEAKLLLNRFNDSASRRKSKPEKKASVQVAFGYGAKSSTSSVRSFGVQKDDSSAKSSGSKLKDLATDHEHWKIGLSSYPTVDDHAMVERFSDVSPGKTSKVYREPWDYNSYYPIVLPLRKPYSGDPELLDVVEFGDSTRNTEDSEDTINSAKDLGLLDEGEQDKMFFFQFPETLPVVKRSASKKGKEIAGKSPQIENRSSSKRGCSLKELSKGYMGKMVVYKSGAVKLKLGDTLFELKPGSDCSFSQHVTAINPVDKQCCDLGNLDKRAVVSPAIDSLLNNVAINLG